MQAHKISILFTFSSVQSSGLFALSSVDSTLEETLELHTGAVVTDCGHTNASSHQPDTSHIFIYLFFSPQTEFIIYDASAPASSDMIASDFKNSKILNDQRPQKRDKRSNNGPEPLFRSVNL